MSIASRRPLPLLVTFAVAASLAAPVAAGADGEPASPAWAPNVPWGAGCEPAPSPALRTAANCGATLVVGEPFRPLTPRRQ